MSASCRLPVTIATVTYNARDPFLETARSLVPFRDRIDEFIVVDGASTDGTAQAIATDPLVTAWKSERDRGIYDAMNKAWVMAKPQNHILFLGAGDTLTSLPEAGELAQGSVLFGDVDLEGRGRFRSKADHRLMLGNTLHHQSMLVPKALHPDPPFDLRYRTYADYQFNVRLFRRGVPFKRSERLLATAAADGVSHQLNVAEMNSVVADQYGWFVAGLSRLYLQLLLLRKTKSRP